MSRSNWWSKIARLAGRNSKASRRAKSSNNKFFKTLHLTVKQLEERVVPAVRVWSGASLLTANWSDPANWVGGVAPQADDNLVFPTGASQLTNTDNFAAATRFRSITITGSGYNISASGSSSVTLVEGVVANYASSSSTFNVPIIMGAPQTFDTANSLATLNLGNVDTGNLLLLTVDGSGNTVIGGSVTDTGSITKQGQGTLTLTGNNTYFGITTINQGVINVQSNTALGDNSTQVVVNIGTGGTAAAGGELQIQGNNLTISKPLFLAGTGVGIGIDANGNGGALQNVSGSNTWSGPIGINNNATTSIGVYQGSMLNISGVISSTQVSGGSLTKVGAGTLELSGSSSNTYTGTTTVLGGVLQLAKSSGLAFSGSLTIGDLRNPTSDPTTGQNSSVVQLLASNQIPALDFYNETLQTVTINPSGELNLNGFNDTVGNLTMVTGAGYSALVTNNGTATGNPGGAGTLSLEGNITLNAGGTTTDPASPTSYATPAATIAGNLDLGTLFSGVNGAGLGSDSIRLITVNPKNQNGGLSGYESPDLNISANITNSLAPVAPATSTAVIGIEKGGTGDLELSGNNSYTGPTILWGGLIDLGSSTALGTGTLGLMNNNTVELRAYTGALSLANAVEMYSGNTVNVVGPNNLTFGGQVTFDGGTHTIYVMDPRETTNFSGGITESVFGTSNLAKAGEGTLELSGASNYTGTTTVNSDGGTLLLRDSGTLPNTSSVTVNNGGVFRLDNTGAANLSNRLNPVATITLNDGKLSFLGANGAASTQTVGAISLSASTSDNIESGVGTGAGSSAVLTLSGLTFGSNSSVNFNGIGADLSATGSNQINFLTNLSLSSLPALSDGILPFATVTGPAGLDFATYAASSSGSNALSVFALPAAAYATSLASATQTSNVKLTSGTFSTATKTVNALLLEPGVVVNTADTTTTLTVTSGEVAMGAGSSLNTAYLNFGSASTLLYATGNTTLGSGPVTISSIITGSGTVTKAGTGRLIVDGANQFSGAINVNEGELDAQNPGTASNPLSVGGTITVLYGASLELGDPNNVNTGSVQVVGRIMNVFGPGFWVTGSNTTVGSDINPTGAFNNLGGSNSWQGTVTVNSVSVDAEALFPGSPYATFTAGFIGSAAGNLTITGAFTGSSDVVKAGPGTITLGGVTTASVSGGWRFLQGTMVLNKAPGVQAINGNTFLIGNDTLSATLIDASSQQIAPGTVFQLSSTGSIVLNPGVSDYVGSVTLTDGTTTSGSAITLGTGSTLTLAGNVTVEQLGLNPTSTGKSTISGGTLALNAYGSSGSVTRTWVVNHGTGGDDLTVTSQMVEGSGLTTTALVKDGLGTLVLGGGTTTGNDLLPNTFIGLTTVNQGTLALAKAPGVNAIGGALTIGDNNVPPVTTGTGTQMSDVVVLRANEQLPDYNAPVIINANGWLNLAGFNETIGNANLQVALTVQGGSVVSTGAGTLTVNGDYLLNAGIGTPATISGNLNLGSSAPRTFSFGHFSGLLYDVIISANLSGSADLIRTSNGGLLLSGNNSAYSGDIFVQSGTLAAGSNTAFGTGTLSIGSTIQAEGGSWTLSNPVTVDNNFTFAGADDLTFTGAANLTGGRTITVTNPAFLTFAGGLGESFGSQNFAKSGVGFLVFTAPVTYSGSTTINAGGGSIIFTGGGTLANTSGITIQLGGSLILDNSTDITGVLGLTNSTPNNTDRLRDLAGITINGGSLDFIGAQGAASTETVGQITFGTNTDSTILSESGTTGGSSAALTAPSLNTIPAGAEVNFVGLGSNLGSGTNHIFFSQTAPTLSNGVLSYGWITESTGDADLASYTAAAGITAPTYTALASATSTSDVKLTASTNLTAATTVGALLLDGGVALGGAFTLTLASGGLIVFAPGISATLAPVTSSIAATTVALSAAATVITDRRTTATMSSNVTGAFALTTAGKGTLALSGTAAYTSATITEGVVSLRSNAGLGTTAATVIAGAQLQVQGNGLTIATPLTLNGTGLSINAGSDATGALRMVDANGTAVGSSEVNTLTGTIALNSANLAIRVDGGATGTGSTPTPANGGATADQLILTGVVSGNNALVKLGPGQLELAGSAANTYTGGTFVNQGTLQLAKTGGTQTTSINATGTGSITVGNEVGGINAAQLIELTSFNISNTNTVTLAVNSTGLVNFNGQSENLGGGTVTLEDGPTASATINTGAATGTLTIRDNVTLNVTAGGAPTAAQIIGSMPWLLTLTSSAARTFTVNDSAAVQDLIISAPVSDSATFGLSGGVTGGITTAGAGRLVLSGANNFQLGFTVGAGETQITNSAALGGGSVTISAGSLVLSNNVTVTNTIAGVTGTGISNDGAIRGSSGSNTLSGNITMTGNTTFGVDAGNTLTLSGAISGAFMVTKMLGGTLVYSGGTANTYTGATNVYEGTLQLAKTVAAGAIAAGTLNVGNDAGGPNSDVVQVENSTQQLNAAVAVTVVPSGLFDLNGFNQTITAGLNLYQDTTYSADVTTSASTGGTTGTLTLAGPVTGNAPGAGALPNSLQPLLSNAPPMTINGNVVLSGTQTFTIAQVNNASTDLLISGPVSGTGGFTKAGAGSMVLSNNNSSILSGTDTVSAGALGAANNGALGSGTVSLSGGILRGDGGSITLSNPITLAASSTLGGFQALTLNGLITVSTATPTLTVTDTAGNGATNAVTIGGNINFTASDDQLTVSNNFNALTTINGTIDDTNGGTTPSFEDAFIKGGLGTLLLTAANNIHGYKQVNAGIERITNAGAIGQASGNMKIASGAELDVNIGGTSTLAVPIQVSGSGYNSVPTGAVRFLSTSGTTSLPDLLTLNANSIIDVDGTAQAIETGLVSGAFSLTKTGTGTLTLSGPVQNTYSGGTIVNQGTLQLGVTAGFNATGTGNMTIGNESGGAGGAQVVELTANQIPAAASVTVLSSGALNPSSAVAGFLGQTPVNEVQVISYGGDVTSGTYALSFLGQTTPSISFNAPASTVASDLQTLSTIGSNVSVTGVPGYYTVTFNGALAGVNLPALTYVTGTLAGTSNSVGIAIPTPGVGTSAQTLTDAVATPTSGSFNLAINGETTSTLAFGATAANIQTAIGGIVGGTSNVTVLGPGVTSGGVNLVVFNGALVNAPIPLMTVPTNTFAPAMTVTPASVSTGVGQETQSITLGGTITAGTYTLAFGGQTTTGISFNAPASTVQSALQALSTIGTGNVTVIGSSAGTGGTYTVVFNNAAGGGFFNDASLPQLVVANNAISGTSPTLTTAKVSPGVAYNEVQTLVTTGTPTFTLTFDGQTTGTLSSPTPAQLQSALQALPSIGTGNVTVAGATGASQTAGAYLIQFQGALSDTNLPEITATASNGTATPGTLVAGTGNTVYNVTVTPGATGTFTLSFGGQTATINAGANANPSDTTGTEPDVQTALQSAWTNVTPSSNIVVIGSANNYTIILEGTLGNLAQNAVTASSTGLSGGTATATLAAAGGINAVQEVVVTGGTFALVFNGQTTGSLSASAAPSAVQTALTSLVNIGVGNVIVTGDPGNYQIMFQNGFGQQVVPLLTAVPATVNVIAETAGQANQIVQNLTLETGSNNSTSITTGTRMLQMNGVLTVNTFGATPSNAPSASISGNLNLGSNAGHVITVNPTFVPVPGVAPSSSPANANLTISATISGATAATTYAIGGGTTVFSGNNTFQGVLDQGALPGLIEGFVQNNAFDTTDPDLGNSGVELSPRMGETNANTGVLGASPTWSTNQTWIYTGQFYSPTGIFSFAKSVDDSFEMIIDGVVRINNGSYSTPMTTGSTFNGNTNGGVTNFGMGPNNDGWHNITIIFGNGSGGAGATTGGTNTSPGWANGSNTNYLNKGFGLSTAGSTSIDGNDYVIPIDPGNGTLFRTSAPGTLILQGTNLYAGATNVGSNLTLNNGGTAASSSGFTVAPAGTLTLDNTAANANRIGASTPITLSGGTLSFLGNGTTATTQTVGNLVLTAGTTSTVQSAAGVSGQALTFAGLTRGAGASVNFVANDNTVDIGNTNNQIIFTTSPTLVGTAGNQIIPYATINGPVAGFNFVTDTGNGTPITPFSNYSNNVNTSGAVVKLSGAGGSEVDALTGSNAINALLMAGSGVNLNTNGFTLTVSSGQVENTGGSNSITDSTATTGTLAFGTAEGEFYVNSASTLTVSAAITGTAAAGLYKELGGTLVLSGANSALTAPVTVAQGVVQMTTNTALGTGLATVNTGAALQIQGPITGTIATPLTLNGIGLTSSPNAPPSPNGGNGALEVLSGSGAVTWGTGTTAVTFNSPTGLAASWTTPATTGTQAATGSGVTIGVDSATDSLTFNATVANDVGFNKVGAGTVTLGGSAANTATLGGTTSSSALGGNILGIGGTVVLGKTGTNNAVTGYITAGNNIGGFGAATIQLSAAGTAQTGTGTNATVNRSGVLNFNGATDSLGTSTTYVALNTFSLTIIDGSVVNTAGGGTVTLGGGVNMTGGSINTSTGTMVLQGNVNTNAGAQATISGNLGLAAGNRTFTVADGPPVDDLAISATINGGGAGGAITKAGAGALLLSGSNTLVGTNNLQTLTFTGTPTGGTFALEYNGATTAPITYSTTLGTSTTPNTLEGNVAAALAALPTIGTTSNFTLGGTATALTVTFTGALAGAANTTMLVTANNLAGGTAPAVAVANTTAGVNAFTLSAGILDVGNNSALGQGDLNVSAGSTIWANGGPITLTNPLYLSGSTLIAGGKRDYGGTNSLTFAAPINGALYGNATIEVDDPLTAVAISGVLGQNNAVENLTKTGQGKLILGGNNPFSGTPSVSAGILDIQNSGALGTGVVPVLVTANAALQIDGTTSNGSVNITNKVLQLQYASGGTTTGYLNNFKGAVENIGGTNTWTVPATVTAITNENTPNVVLDLRSSSSGTGTVFVGSDAGSLDFIGAIDGMQSNSTGLSGANLVKVGAGTIRTSGTQPNQFNGATYILNGTLDINKTPGVDALRGTLTIGDNVNPATVRLLGNQQLANVGAVTVNSTGKIDTSASLITVNELQNINLGGPTGGTFTLTYAGQTTSALNFYATPAQVQAALQALPSIGTGNVSVTSAPAVNAVQTLTFGGTVTGGTFTLTFNGETTGAITWSGTTATLQTNIQNALNSLLGSGNTSVSNAANPTVTFQNALAGEALPTMTATSSLTGTSPTLTVATTTGGQENYIVTFTGALAGANQNQITVGTGSLTGQATTPLVTTLEDGAGTGANLTTGTQSPSGYVGGPNNTVEFVSTGGATGGTFTLTFNGQTDTIPINFNDTAATVATDLATIPLIGSTSNVDVTAVANAAGGGNSYIVAFTGTLAGANQNPMTLNNTSLVGTTSTPDVGTMANGGGWDASQQPNNGLTTGTFTLAFNGATTGALAYNISAQALQSALEGLSSIGQGNVIVTQTPTVGAYGVTFQGALAGINQPLMTISAGTVNGAITTGGSASQVEVINLNGATTGSYTLTYNGQTTASIAYNASAATVQSALTALTNISTQNAGAVANVTVTNPVAGLYYVQFQTSTLGYTSPLSGGVQPTITITNSTLAGGGATQALVTTPGGVQLAYLNNAVTLVNSGAIGSAAGGSSFTAGGAAITSGSGTNVLTLGNNLTVSALAGEIEGTASSFVPATISGNLALEPVFSSAAATRTFTVNNTPANQNTTGLLNDLVVTANIYDGAPYAGGLTKAGTGIGRMVLNPTGTSTYSGVTTITSGILNIQAPSALGVSLLGTTAAAANEVTNANSANAVLEIQGGITVTDKLLILHNVGAFAYASGEVPTIRPDTPYTLEGAGALRSVSGANSWVSSTGTGNILQLANTGPSPSIGVDPGSSLTINGVITDGGAGFTKVGTGTLTLGGSAANVITGNIGINEGTLILNKTVGAALSGTVTVGDNRQGVAGNSVQDADILRYGPNATTTDPNQIGTNTINIQSSGKLDLATNNVSTIAGTINWVEGPNGSADVQTGTGTLTLQNTGAVYIQGGTNSSSPAVTIAGNLALGANRQLTVWRSAAPSSLTISAPISGAFTFTKAGSGLMNLTAVNTYSGATTITEGTLRVDSGGSLAAGSAVAVNAGGTLAGTGTVNGAVTLNSPSATAAVGGTLAPGTATNPGVLTVANNVTFNSGSIFSVKLNGNTVGTGTTTSGYDQLNITGASNKVTINAGALLQGTTGNGYVPASGDALKIIAGTTNISGTFTNAANQGAVAIGNAIYQSVYNVTSPTNSTALAGALVLGKAFSADYDMGASTSPVQANYTQVTGTTAYSPGSFGWVAPVNSADRGNIAGSPDTALLEDFDWFQSGAGTFQVDVPNGTYQVTLTFGDTASARTLPAIFTNNNGAAGATVQVLAQPGTTLAAGQFTTETVTTVVTNGTLQVAPQYTGSATDTTVFLEGLDVRLTSAVGSTIVVNSPLLNLAGNTTVTLSGRATDLAGNPLPQGTEITITPPTGTVVTTDVDSAFAGNQAIVTDANGDFTFQIQTPASGSGGTLNFAAVNGAATGTATFTVASSSIDDYDFGIAGSPVQAGYTPVLNTATYTAGGYGWDAAVNGADRGPIAGSPYSALLEDFDWFQSGAGTFQVDVPNGTYQVTLTFGDTLSSRTLPAIFTNNNGAAGATVQVLAQPSPNINTAPGQFLTETATTVVTNGTLKVAPQYTGSATDSTVFLEALDLRLTSQVSSNVTVTQSLTNLAPGEILTLTGRAVDTNGNPLPQGTEITISTTAGTFLPSDDVDSAYGGTQVAISDNNGDFTFHLVTPGAVGTTPSGTISFAAVNGAAAASLPFTLAPPSTAGHFQFNAGGPTEAGYVPLQGSTVYTAATGYGWLSAVNSADRGSIATDATSPANSQSALLRAFNWGSNGTFEADGLSPGTYNVVLTFGDAQGYHSVPAIATNNNANPGSLSQVVAQGAELNLGVFDPVSFTTVVNASGTMQIQLYYTNPAATPDGGNWTVSSLDYEKVGASDQITLTPTQGATSGSPVTGRTVVTVNGVAKDQSGNYLPQGTEITVSTTVGVITSADLDPNYPGIQTAVTDSTGDFSFQLQTPATASTIALTASTHNGVASGTANVYTSANFQSPGQDGLQLDFNAPATLNTPSSPTQVNSAAVQAAGYGAGDSSSWLPVLPSLTYSAANGYGWAPGTSVNAVDRGTNVAADGSGTPALANLQRDAQYANDATFEVSVPNPSSGSYTITLFLGDQAAAHENMTVKINGVAVTTSGGTFNWSSVNFNGGGGQLNANGTINTGGNGVSTFNGGYAIATVTIPSSVAGGNFTTPGLLTIEVSVPAGQGTGNGLDPNFYLDGLMITDPPLASPATSGGAAPRALIVSAPAGTAVTTAAVFAGSSPAPLTGVDLVAAAMGANNGGKPVPADLAAALDYALARLELPAAATVDEGYGAAHENDQLFLGSDRDAWASPLGSVDSAAVLATGTSATQQATQADGLAQLPVDTIDQLFDDFAV